MKTIRKHLGDLTFKEAPIVVTDPKWHEGVTEAWFTSINWNSIRTSEESLTAFEREIYLKIYLGGIEPSIRKDVSVWQIKQLIYKNEVDS